MKLRTKVILLLLTIILILAFYPLTARDSTGSFEGKEKEIAFKAIKETRSQIDEGNIFYPRFEVTEIEYTDNDDCPNVYLKGYTYFNIYAMKAKGNCSYGCFRKPNEEMC